jgi:uncharacterized protein (TIGR03086 family)
MAQWSVIDEAHAALRSAVAGVPAGAWDRPTPCADWNVTQVLQHAAGDQVGFAATITDGPWPSEDPFQPSGRLDGDPATVAAEAMAAAARAWSTIAPDADSVKVPVPPGALPAPVGAGACALDAAVHAWDIAVATGQPSPLTPALARDLHEVARRIVEPLRAFGAYAEVLPAADGDGDVDALLRYLGRDPAWTGPGRHAVAPSTDV